MWYQVVVLYHFRDHSCQFSLGTTSYHHNNKLFHDFLFKFKFYHEKLFHTSCNFLCATNALLVNFHPESQWHMTSSEPRL